MYLHCETHLINSYSETYSATALKINFVILKEHIFAITIKKFISQSLE